MYGIFLFPTARSHAKEKPKTITLHYYRFFKYIFMFCSLSVFSRLKMMNRNEVQLYVNQCCEGL